MSPTCCVLVLLIRFSHFFSIFRIFSAFFDIFTSSPYRVVLMCYKATCTNICVYPFSVALTRSTLWYIYIYICVYIYICLCMYTIYEYMCTGVYRCIRICKYVYIKQYLHISICISMYIYICFVFLHVNMQ